jgi:hypothetical protein
MRKALVYVVFVQIRRKPGSSPRSSNRVLTQQTGMLYLATTQSLKNVSGLENLGFSIYFHGKEIIRMENIREK